MSTLPYTYNTTNSHIVHTCTHAHHIYTYIMHTHIPHPVHEWDTNTFTCISHVYTICTPLPPRMGSKYKYTYIICTLLPLRMDTKYKYMYIIRSPLPPRMDTIYNVANNLANNSANTFVFHRLEMGKTYKNFEEKLQIIRIIWQELSSRVSGKVCW